MIVLAIVATLVAVIWSFIVVCANGMRSSPGAFMGGFTLTATWIGVAVLWFAWWIG